MRSAIESSHASWMNLHRIRGSERHGSSCQVGDVRPLAPACGPRICCRRNENRSMLRSVHRMRYVRQPGNVKPECRRIALRRGSLLLPVPLAAPGSAAETKPLAAELCVGAVPGSHRSATALMPDSAGLILYPETTAPCRPASRLSLLRSNPLASWQ